MLGNEAVVGGSRWPCTIKTPGPMATEPARELTEPGASGSSPLWGPSGNVRIIVATWVTWVRAVVTAGMGIVPNCQR